MVGNFLVKTPKRLQALVQDGIIDRVEAQLMSGKEAVVYVVKSYGNIRCAKIYKDAQTRSFKNSSKYTDGRKARGSRQNRAMGKKSRYGRQEQEEAWQSGEVSFLGRLESVGVRVPKVYDFAHGVLIMELIIDEENYVAPRLSEVNFTESDARDCYLELVDFSVKMLSSGIIHGDLSEYNILYGSQGPVIIDLPQAIDASHSNNAKALFLKDMEQLKIFFSNFCPELKKYNYGPEIWNLYKSGLLKLDSFSSLTGQFVEKSSKVNVKNVLDVIEDARFDAESKQNK